jgi:hypothetical protein
LKLIDMFPADDRPAASLKVTRPDSAILNEAIPVFAIGRSNNGLWIAHDCDSAAVRFAKRSGGACALMFERDGLELDGTASPAHRSRHLKAGLETAIANIKTRVYNWVRSRGRAASGAT